jgi:hypothetical protein
MKTPRTSKILLLRKTLSGRNLQGLGGTQLIQLHNIRITKIKFWRRSGALSKKEPITLMWRLKSTKTAKMVYF